MHLAVEGRKESLTLLILPFQTRQHQRQERLLAQQGHAGHGRDRKTQQRDHGLETRQLPTHCPSPRLCSVRSSPLLNCAHFYPPTFHLSMGFILSPCLKCSGLGPLPLLSTPQSHSRQGLYLFCFCRSRSLREEEPRCWPFSNSSPAAFSTCPWTEVGSLAMRGATSQTPERSRELEDRRSPPGYRAARHG